MYGCDKFRNVYADKDGIHPLTDNGFANPNAAEYQCEHPEVGERVGHARAPSRFPPSLCTPPRPHFTPRPSTLLSNSLIPVLTRFPLLSSI